MGVACYESGVLWVWPVMSWVCYGCGLFRVGCAMGVACYELGVLWVWPVTTWACYGCGLIRVGCAMGVCHCSVLVHEGTSVSLEPSSPDAQTYVNGQLLNHSKLLHHVRELMAGLLGPALLTVCVSS